MPRDGLMVTVMLFDKSIGLAQFARHDQDSALFHLAGPTQGRFGGSAASEIHPHRKQ